MRIGIQTWGSEGDVRPFMALAAGLRASGHVVTLVITNPAMPDYSAYAASLDINIIHVHESYSGWDKTFPVGEVFADGKLLSRNPLRQAISLFEDIFEPGVAEMYEAAKTLCAANDIVIGHSIHHPLQLAAEQSRTPYAAVVLSPLTLPSQYLPPLGLPDLGKWLSTGLWKLTGILANRALLKFPNRLRSRAGFPLAKDLLSEVVLSKQLTLIATSPTLFERPADWPENLQICGFLAMPDNSQQWLMPPDLEKFISTGAPPVYMTFGSITPLVQEQAMNLFVKAVKLVGCRTIIQSRWLMQHDVPQHPDIHTLESAPHQMIFPRCALVVHHGGAGTSHSASVCGRPSIVVELFGDQDFNATLLKRAGFAHQTLHFRTVTPEILAAEIRHVLADSALKQSAALAGACMRNEDGVGRAVELVENVFANVVST